MEASSKTVRQGSNFPNLTIIWAVSSEEVRGTCMQVKGNTKKRIARVRFFILVGWSIVWKGSQAKVVPNWDFRMFMARRSECLRSM
jgi:predicted membrane channel-forming protein YqfA (hemolysin III family)